jgi:hypothetical protein
VTKLSLAGASLAAAIPGGFLAFLIGADLVGKFGEMAAPVWIFASLSLVACALAILLPPGILIFGPKGAAAAKPKEKKEKAAAEKTTKVADADDAEEAEEAPASETFATEEDEVEPLSDSDVDAAETMDFEDDSDPFEDDEPKPKKKR